MPKESAYFRVESLDSKRDVKDIKRQLDAIPGVISVSINAQEAKVAVDFDNSGVKQADIRKRLVESGYDVASVSGEEHVM